MDLQSAYTNDDYIEYIVTGAHALTWMMTLVLYLLRIPFSDLLNVSVVALLVALPFTYVIGVMVDSLSRLALVPFWFALRRLFFHYSVCPDEFIALRSPTLYTAYERRMRRTRIPGAATLNWLLLGGVLCLTFEHPGSSAFGIVLIACALLSVLSFLTWVDLYQRAYTFRRNVCQQLGQDGSAPDVLLESVTTVAAQHRSGFGSAPEQ